MGRTTSAVAATYDNLRHTVVVGTGRCALELLPRFHRDAHTPTRNLTNFLWLEAIFESTRRAGSRVLLSGLAGNCTISWIGAGSVRELVRRWRWRLAIAQARLEARADGRPSWLALPLATASALRLRGRQRIVDPPGRSLLNSHHRPSRNRSGALWRPRAETRDYWIAFATRPWVHWYPNPIELWNLDWRNPLANRALMEGLMTFPDHAFRTGGRARGLARELAGGLLPDRTRLRRTQGMRVAEAPG